MKSFFLLVLAAAPVCSAFSQKLPGENSFGLYSDKSTNLSEEALFTVLTPYAGTGKAGTEAAVTQTGNSNVSQLNFSGSGNLINAYQNGNENNLNLDFSGRNSRLVLEQNGNNNTIQMNNITGSNANFRAVQTDDGNNLNIIGSQVGPLGSMKIEQSGGMTTIVTANPIFSRP